MDEMGPPLHLCQDEGAPVPPAGGLSHYYVVGPDSGHTR
jgi:hypothetical protein